MKAIFGLSLAALCHPFAAAPAAAWEVIGAGGERSRPLPPASGRAEGAFAGFAPGKTERYARLRVGVSSATGASG